MIRSLPSTALLAILAPFAVVAATALVACDAGTSERRSAGSAEAESARAGGTGSGREGSPAAIDPGAVAVGDTVAGLTVRAVDVQRLAGASGIWTGRVAFEGALTLEGVYLPHFDYPDVDALCFHPDSASARRLPRFAPDARTSPDRKRWFCFRDAGRVRAALADPSQPREARVRVRGYTVHRQFSDVWDEAELVAVLETGVERENTLRGERAQPVLRSLSR